MAGSLPKTHVAIAVPTSLRSGITWESGIDGLLTTAFLKRLEARE